MPPAPSRTIRRTSVRLGALLLGVALAAGMASPAHAARPLLDQHQWDAYFALFARDSYVPWKPTVIRLDTYSGAPVDFAAYAVDPADVIVAGPSSLARPIDTAHRTAVVRWRFSPPPGYRFVTNDVPVPLGGREGFFVVEARRGAARQQVWVNRSHVGLVSIASPNGLTLWSADLHSGTGIARAPIDFLVGSHLVRQTSGAGGLTVWRGAGRPTFALATVGPARAFLSILPQPPPPATVVALRLDAADVRAGGAVRFAGFARRRIGGTYRRATGEVRVSLVGTGRTLAATGAQLDAAGAFSGSFDVPAGTDAGDFSVLASVPGGVGGATVHVDAASDVALAIAPPCPCKADVDVPIAVVAKRDGAAAAGISVVVRVVRTPHIVPPGVSDGARRWGTTLVVDRTLRTDANGRARVVVPAPTDGLDSTYGISASTRGATASARAVVPNGPLALSIEPEADESDVGQPIVFDVRGFDPSDGSPAAGLAVGVRLTHGASAQTRSLTLDARGRGRLVFARPELGSNLALATATAGGVPVADASAVLVEPQALGTRPPRGADAGIALTTQPADAPPTGTIAARVAAPGATGDALLALGGVRTYAARTVPLAGGAASSSFALADPQGGVTVAAGVVRDGAIVLASTPVAIDGPGRALATRVSLDHASYAPGEAIHATIADGTPPGGATIVARITLGRASGSADFDDAAAVMSGGTTSLQTTAAADAQWHAYVAPAGSKASDIFAAERPRRSGAEAPALVAAAPPVASWDVSHAAGATVDAIAPSARGHYVFALLRIAENGDVGSASVSFDVK